MWTVTEKPKYRDYREMRRGRSCWAPATIFLVALMLYALWVQNGQTTKIAEAENREQEMSLEIKKYQNQLKKAETDLERSLKEGSDQKDELEQLNRKITDLEKAAAVNKNRVRNVEIERDSLQTESEQIKQHDEELESSLNSKIINLSQLETEKQQLKEDNQKHEKEIDSLKMEVTDLKNKLLAEEQARANDAIQQETIVNPPPDGAPIDKSEDSPIPDPAQLPDHLTNGKAAIIDEENESDTQLSDGDEDDGAAFYDDAQSDALDTDDDDYPNLDPKEQDTVYENKADEDTNDDTYDNR